MASVLALATRNASRETPSAVKSNKHKSLNRQSFLNKCLRAIAVLSFLSSVYLFYM